MLEKPNISDELIISHLQSEFGFYVAKLEFLPLGADLGTVVYRVAAEDGATYFLKLRKGFDEITVTVPRFLEQQGVQEIISPIETNSKQGWADFGGYKMILYPFIEGKNGFEIELTDQHRRTLGTALKAIHSALIPSELKSLIPWENFSRQERESAKSLQALAGRKTFEDPTAEKLARFMKSKQNQITRLIHRTEQLASELQSIPLDLVLCHSDIHGGNILISDNNELYIVDWDNSILAPKERDLMFIGGGIDAIWNGEHEEAVFYEGYGKTEINLKALTYYRCERVIQDLAVIGRQLLLTNEGGADRERSYGWFTSNFEPGQTIEIAQRTDIFFH